MRVLVIPDVHLKPWMFDRAAEIMSEGAAGQAVCLMDIPDDWGHEYDLGLYEDTFDAAIRFQKKFPNTLWCYGNHDLSYIWNQTENGFSPYALPTVNRKIQELIGYISDRKQIGYIHRIDNVLFVHGGLTEKFVNRHIRTCDQEDCDQVIRLINGFGLKEVWTDGSPIFFRPQFYNERMYKETDFLQVVGHTPVMQIYRLGNVVSCDLFSTYRAGKPIGTEEFLLIDTKTWDYSGIKLKNKMSLLWKYDR